MRKKKFKEISGWLIRSIYPEGLLMYGLMICMLGIFTESKAASSFSGEEQQVRKITGTVLSKSDNSTVVGASVLIVGTNVGTITDLDGKFTITNVPANAKEVKISFIGMTTQTLPLRSNMTVFLENDTQQLDEVIVVAYGTAKKSSFTGSASLVKSDKLETKPTTTITDALVGAVSGVEVSTANG